jgi:hypothetical protein
MINALMNPRGFYILIIDHNLFTLEGQKYRIMTSSKIDESFSHSKFLAPKDLIQTYEEAKVLAIKIKSRLAADMELIIVEKQETVAIHTIHEVSLG